MFCDFLILCNSFGRYFRVEVGRWRSSGGRLCNHGGGSLGCGLITNRKTS